MKVSCFSFQFVRDFVSNFSCLKSLSWSAKYYSKMLFNWKVQIWFCQNSESINFYLHFNSSGTSSQNSKLWLVLLFDLSKVQCHIWFKCFYLWMGINSNNSKSKQCFSYLSEQCEYNSFFFTIISSSISSSLSSG